jgi:hypothetical protein
VSRIDLTGSVALVAEVKRDRTDGSTEREHASRDQREPAHVGSRDRPLSLELDLVRERPLTHLALDPRLGFEPHAFHFSLTNGAEPRLLLAFCARTFCDLALTLSRRFFSLPGKPLGRLSTLALALARTLELFGALAFHAAALLAHERFQRKEQ